jgi:hypothetical protein
VGWEAGLKEVEVERERRETRVSERQPVVRLFNGAVNVREALGTRAQDQVQGSEKERPDDSLRELGVRHALAADVGRARSRAAGHPRLPQRGNSPAAGSERVLFLFCGTIKQQASKQDASLGLDSISGSGAFYCR